MSNYGNLLFRGAQNKQIHIHVDQPSLLLQIQDNQQYNNYNNYYNCPYHDQDWCEHRHHHGDSLSMSDLELATGIVKVTAAGIQSTGEITKSILEVVRNSIIAKKENEQSTETNSPDASFGSPTTQSSTKKSSTSGTSSSEITFVEPKNAEKIANSYSKLITNALTLFKNGNNITSENLETLKKANENADKQRTEIWTEMAKLKEKHDKYERLSKSENPMDRIDFQNNYEDIHTAYKDYEKYAKAEKILSDKLAEGTTKYTEYKSKFDTQ